VVTNACAYYTSRTRLRVQRAPGIPHALFGRKIQAQLGRNASRGCESVSKLSASLRANGSRECALDDRFREAIHSFFAAIWTASLRSQ
jgi:hypothetical protein